MKKDITELFCFIDDFCKLYEKYEQSKLLPSNKTRNRSVNMSLSEMLTISIMFHTSYAKNFKFFYKSYIEYLYREDFSNILSYNRFIELMPRLFMPLNMLLHLLFGEKTGIYFIDSTAISVCHNKRRYINKVFSNLAMSGKSSIGFFHGFKLHAIINNKG